MANLDLTKALSVVGQLPQTQSDIKKIASAADYTQTPQFQQQLKTAESYAFNYAVATLALQTASTLILLGMFLVNLQREKRMNAPKN